ncbi:MAG TPA: aminotransferase class IV [Planctomycetota bacterium]|nr:aminotransferase class IV [Planctomycetota bacterium]
MANLCNLDGVTLPEEQARIPVLDRGFLFGDSIYEVLRTHAGVPFAWPEHLLRLRSSASGLGLVLDLDDRALMARVQATLAAADNEESYVRIIVTRGTGSAPNIDFAHAPGPPRWVILVRALTASPGQPVRLAIIDRLRTDRRALDPALKSGNYLNNVMGLAEAKAAGATDCLMVNGNGQVTEASTSNLFAFRGDRLLTPPLHAGILAGITRGLLLGLCRQQRIDVQETDLTAADVRAADELFLSSTLRDVAPVTHLDGRPFHAGEPGPRTVQLLADFTAFARTASRGRYAPELARLLAGGGVAGGGVAGGRG